MKNLPFKGTLVATAAGLALVACGGGGDNYDVATAGTPPPSASTSSQGMLEFIDGLFSQALDGREPYDLAAFSLPTDDADSKEPVRLSIDQ